MRQGQTVYAVIRGLEGKEFKFRAMPIFVQSDKAPEPLEGDIVTAAPRQYLLEAIKRGAYIYASRRKARAHAKRFNNLCGCK